jgi:hypothetical protein
MSEAITDSKLSNELASTQIDLPDDLKKISERYGVITDPTEKRAFVENPENYKPVLEWYCEYVRVKFFPDAEVGTKHEKLFREIYDPENLPKDKKWFQHVLDIIHPVELSEEELETLRKTLIQIREDLSIVGVSVQEVTKNDYIRSHVLAGFDYAIQIAFMVESGELKGDFEME